MNSGGFSWKAFLGSLLGLLGACAAAAWIGATYLSQPGRAESRLNAAVAIAALASGGAAICAYLLSRSRQRLLERIVNTVRGLAYDAAHSATDFPPSAELVLLASALNDMRRRLASQVETIDRQRQTLASLVNQLREGVIVVRPDGCIALLNPAAIRLLNLDVRGGEASFIGRPIERCVPQHDLQALARRESPDKPAIVEPGRTHPLPWDAPSSNNEARLQVDSPAGSLHLLVHATDLALPEADAGGAPLGRLLVLLDITELTRTVQIKTDFVANASHELRTPISTISAAAETLLSMNLAEDADAAQRFLSVIERHSARLEALVSDLLDLARVESPAARFEARTMDLTELLDELHGRFAESIARKRLEWSTDLSACRNRLIVASPHLLNLVLDNLVDNAVKYTESGGRIRVACREGASWTSFEVADSGCGIPEAEQERVFERFYQVERARSGAERGTGLGLSIVRHAVSAMRATISLHSQLGKGTRFTVTIPQDA